MSQHFSNSKRGIRPDGDKAEEVLPSYSVFRRVLLLGEADFSFTKAFAQEQTATIGKGSGYEGTEMKIVASEYGSGIEIANRYFDADQQRLSDHLHSILQFKSVEEVISGLNARNLGNFNARRRKKTVTSDDPNKLDKEHICTCSRWNVALKCWDKPSPFWRNDAIEDSNVSISNQYDLVIFNFPHSDQAGRATRLVKAFFKQMRICIDAGKLKNDVVIEMRLRTIETNPLYKRNIRSFYRHEESAEESGFTLKGCWPSDLQRWEKRGYKHKMTKKNETCRDIDTDCKVWRWISV